MVTRLFLIRHGITKWNKERRYCGYKDVALSNEGKAQAWKLEKSLKGINFDRVYCSDRKRALETCRIIFHRARITKVKGLREIHFGVLEGLHHKEIMAKYAFVYKKWLKDPFKHNIPRAEPMNAFKKRVRASIKKIVSLNSGKSVAVICHGGSIGVFISDILKNRNFWRHVPAAASITVVEYKKGKPKLKQFNDIKHLR
ncbi:MAG: histidine phosphatase family protein [bacterium]